MINFISMIVLDLNEELEAKLAKTAASQGISKPEFLRQLLVDCLNRDDQANQTPWELGKDLFGKYGSGRTDLSRNRKAILKEKLRAKQSRH